MTATPTVDSPTAPPARRGFLRRWWWKLLLLLVVLVLVVVALLPTLASTATGTRMALGFANDAIPGQIALDDLSVGWFSGLRIQGVSLRDPEGEVVATIKDIDARDASLRRLLSSYTRPGTIRIIEPVANIVAYEDGSTNLTRALVRPHPQASTPSEPAPADTPASDGPTFSDVSLRIEFDNARLAYTAPGIEPIHVHVRLLVSDASSLHTQTITLDAAIRQGPDEGLITGDLKISELLDEALAPHPEKAEVAADVAIKNLPVAAVDRLAGQGGRLVATLGPKLDATIKASGPLRQLTAQVLATSERLGVAAEVGVEGDRFTASPGAKASLHVTPETWAAWSPTGPRLSAPFDVVMLVNELAAPQKGDAPQLDAAAVDLRVAIGDIVLDAGPTLGSLSLRQTTLTAQTPRLGDKLTVKLASHAEQNGRGGAITLDADVARLILPDGSLNPTPSAIVAGAIADLPVAIIDELAGLGGLAAAAIGPTLDATLAGQLQQGPGDTPVGTVQLTADAQHLDARIGGTIGSDTFTADDTGRITWRVQPAVAAKLLAPAEGGEAALTLDQPATVTVLLTRLDAPLADFSTARVTAGVRVQVDQLALGGDPKLAGTTLRDLVVDLPATKLDQPLTAGIKGQLQRGTRTAALEGKATLADMVVATNTPRANAALTVTGLPVELLDTLGDQGGTLTALLADTIDKVVVTADAELGETARYVATAKVADDRLGADVAAIYTPAGLSVRDSWATLNVTPAAFAAYHKTTASDGDGGGEPLQLTEPLALRADITQADIALGDAGLDPARTRLDARITVPSVAVRQGSGQPYALRNLDLTAKTDNLQNRLDLKAKASIASTTKPGELASATTITKLYNEAGTLDLNTLELTTDTTASSISVALLDVLAGMEGKLVDTLGDMAEAKVVGTFPGDLDVTLQSPTASATLKPAVTRDRRITLREDAVVMLQLTPRMAKSVLAPLNLALGDATASKGPIKLTINRKPFDVPLTSDKLMEEMKLTGSLELGTLIMDRKGVIGGGIDALVSQIGQKIGLGGKAPPDETYEVAFTPMEFRIANGRVKPTELWMTSEDMGAGFQGTVNLANQTADMKMGLLGATLIARGHPKVAEVIEPGRVYEIVMSGPLSSPKLDYTALLGALAFGAGKQQLEGPARAGVELLEGLVQGATDPKGGPALQWTPPPAASELVQRITAPPQPAQAQPLTPEERQRRREQRQQPQNQPQDTTPPPASPLDQLLNEVLPKDEPAKPGEPVVSDEERARRREERRKQREAERQQQQQ